MEHILPLYDNAPSHELYDYCARVGDEEISRCEESGLVPYDMRVQLQIHLWIFTHAYWRKPKEAF